MFSFPIVALLIVSAQAAVLTLQAPKIIVTSAAGLQLRSEPYVLSHHRKLIMNWHGIEFTEYP